MGYFSDYAFDGFGDYEDGAYMAPEKTLLRRLDDLKDRLAELIAEGAAYRNSLVYSEGDLRAALPEHLGDISKVERAIELTKEDLLGRFGIRTGAGETEPAAAARSDAYEQITLVGLLPAALTLTPEAA